MSRPRPSLVYSPHYDIRLLGLEKLHPFDSCKYGRAWGRLRAEFGDELGRWAVDVPAPAGAELGRVHSADYLRRLRSSGHVAGVLELPFVAMLPSCVVDRAVLRPMRWATAGTVLAAHRALDGGMAVNLSGGYHHAGPDRGEGFCAYADVPAAVADLRRGRLGPADTVLIVDLDAHQGNGNSRSFLRDDRVYLLDMYNADIYPRDPEARDRVDRPVPLESGCGDATYLRKLVENLDRALADLAGARRPAVAFYNAGTDVYAGDRLGRLGLSAEAVLERDRLVLSRLTEAGIPWVLVPSGGYSRRSYEFLAETAAHVLRTWGRDPSTPKPTAPTGPRPTEIDAMSDEPIRPRPADEPGRPAPEPDPKDRDKVRKVQKVQGLASLAGTLWDLGRKIRGDS